MLYQRVNKVMVEWMHKFKTSIQQAHTHSTLIVVLSIN